MRSRSGSVLKLPALCRAFLVPAVLAVLPVPAAAQYDPDGDGTVVEEVFDEHEGETGASSSGPAAFSVPVSNSAQSASGSALYLEPPDVARCSAGKLREDARRNFFISFNNLRKRHGLPPVAYNAAGDAETGEAALMMTANRALSHFPPRSWACWTEAGARASARSNLLGSTASPTLALDNDDDVLAAWLIEGDGDEIGHRRWLLDPYLEQVSFGRVIALMPGGVRVDSAVLKVFGFPDSAPRHRSVAQRLPAFVAWPQGDYPARFFSPRARLSFSVTEDPEILTKIDYSQAKVTIRFGENILPVRDQLWDTEGYGLANSLTWRVDGIDPDRTYTVSISGVRGAPHESYEYAFRIIK